MPRRLAAGALTLAFLVAASLSVVGARSAGQAPAARGAGLERGGVASLDDLAASFQFAALRRALKATEPGPERDYFAGVLANREGRVAESVRLLEGVLPAVKASNARRAADALRILADDYVKMFRYADAAAAYDDLSRGLMSQFGASERRAIEDDAATVRLLKGAPAQEISFDGAVDLSTHRNKTLDTVDADLTVNGVTESWIVDTGANFSAITASFARRLGLAPSKEKAQTQGITGAENDLRTAILPELKMGGATVRNVVLVVLNDASFNVPAGRSRYQINAVLGYPVLQALQRMTFTGDGHLLAGPGSPSGGGGAALYMHQLMPLLECEVSGRPVVFSLDTGADRSLFSVRYAREFPGQLEGLSKKGHGMGGAGGVRKVLAYFLPHPQLRVGDVDVTLHEVPVVPELGTDTDKVFGNIGRDLTDQFSSFTIDFVAMRLRLGEARKQPSSAR